MLNLFIRYCENERLFTPESRVLLAVSGGIDSMVMARLFSEAGVVHGIAHCNFALRGSESDGDEQFVAGWASTAGIPFHSARFETESYAQTEGISLQMAARRLRYEWFDTLLDSEGYETVAVAHNRDDNAETFLINLLRGTGINGLTGMAPRTERVIRPLLFAGREQIEAFAAREGVGWREDSSNRELSYLRNRIRHKVIPEMERASGGARDAIANTMEHLAEAAVILNSHFDELRKELFTTEGESVTVPVNRLRVLTPAGIHIFGLFRPYGITPGQVTGIISLLSSPTGRWVTTATHRLLSDRGRIIITPATAEQVREQLFNTPEEMRRSNLFSELTITAPPEEVHSSSRLTAAFDLDSVTFPVTVRRWQPGDRLMPLGMKNMKKVSDLLTDLKVPVTEKEKVMLLLSGGKTMWVMGYRMDERFRIREDTSSMLKITLRKDNDEISLLTSP